MTGSLWKESEQLALPSAYESLGLSPWGQGRVAKCLPVSCRYSAQFMPLRTTMLHCVCVYACVCVRACVHVSVYGQPLSHMQAHTIHCALSSG